MFDDEEEEAEVEKDESLTDDDDEEEDEDEDDSEITGYVADWGRVLGGIFFWGFGLCLEGRGRWRILILF